MAANPNWTRWIHASVAKALKKVATDATIPVLIESIDERTKAFMEATDRVEIRVTGPFSQELSAGYYRVYVDANVLLTSRYDGAKKNAYTLLKNTGLFHEAMDKPIAVWNYGGEAGDFVEADDDTQVFIGCLIPRPGNGESVKVFNFGQTDKTDKLKQSVVDVRYVMFITVQE